VGNANNHHFKIYQFINSSKVREMNYINAVLNYKAAICFDLEDSIKTDENNYNQIRTLVFSDVLELIKNKKKLEIGIRINPINSKYYLDDIVQFSRFSNSDIHFNIFLPKVSSSFDVKKCFDEITMNKIQDFEIIPIIESKQGFKNLNCIINNSTGYISKIAFGHCDYNLDCDYFPFYHQDSNEYWNWVNNIISACGNEITFLNSPYLNLNDDELLINIISKLEKVKNNCGQITLSLRQSKVCSSYNQQDYKFSDHPKSIVNVKDVKKFAMDLVNKFEKYKVEGKNFAIVSETKNLISPQEYNKAKEIIRKFNENKNRSTDCGRMFSGSKQYSR
jgi:citrate lyase beta subunit